MNDQKPVRESVALAIRGEDHEGQEQARILAVLRPPDDPELPDVWGLPAATLRPGETTEDAARRAGTEKLGVELSIGAEIRRGSTDRLGYRLDMSLREARIVNGQPAVPQPHPEVTQYTACRWAEPSILLPAADLGSLCCRLFLEASDDPLD
jgi:8-oxo-dGTP pyrophosphatase MutT (NUDIX family)